MKPVLLIADLIKQPAFGINKVHKVAAENIQEAIFESYEFIRGGRVLRAKVQRRNPAVENRLMTQFIELPVDPTDEMNELFMQEVKDGAYVEHGELKQNEFKDAFLDLYLPILEAKLSYGSSAVLDKVIHGKNNDVIYFTTTEEATGKVRNHTALWKRTELSVDVNSIIVIPRTLYRTYRDFVALLAKALGTETTRIAVKEDPLVVAEHVTVSMRADDLAYRGTIRVSTPATGDKVAVYPKGEVVPGEEEPEGGEEEDLTPPSSEQSDNNPDSPVAAKAPVVETPPAQTEGSNPESEGDEPKV